MKKYKFTTKDKEGLAKLGVGILYLFGSRARGVAHEKSDYDVGIVFIDQKKIDSGIEQFSNIYNILTNVFPDTIYGPKLDISFLQKANAALQMSAICHGIVLFETENNPVFKANYEESVFKKYDDYRFLQNEYEKATFSAFGKKQLKIHA